MSGNGGALVYAYGAVIIVETAVIGATCYVAASVALAFPIPTALAAAGLAAYRLSGGAPALREGEDVLLGATGCAAAAIVAGPLAGAGAAAAGVLVADYIDQRTRPQNYDARRAALRRRMEDEAEAKKSAIAILEDPADDDLVLVETAPPQRATEPAQRGPQP
jgi:hypothetical protein